MKRRDLIPWRGKVAYLGVFLALALICSYVESLIPFYFGIPGVKLGLTNIVVVFAFVSCGGERGASDIDCARFPGWFFVWQHVQYHLQPGGSYVQLCGHDAD